MPDASFIDTKREVVFGHAYESGNGQVVIDQHASDDECLRAPATHVDTPMHRCRVYLKDLLPREWLDRKGTFLIDRGTTRNGEVVSVQISFIPSSS